MASPLKLYEHKEFRQLVARVAAERGIAEAWVEKDYYMTEVLRLIAAVYPDQTMLKGGTSLSKGWLLLDRISEDIDLFLDPEAFPRGKGGRVIGATAIDKRFKRLRDTIEAFPAFTRDAAESNTVGGFGRADRFSYKPLFDSPVFTIRPSVLLEAGIQSGREPQETREISSFVAEYARRTGQGEMAEDTLPFQMRVLHFRRTFVEKMFAIHGKVARFQEDGTRLDRHARHYADIFVLAARSEVRAMLSGPEYKQIREDYDAKSRTYFEKTYRPPVGLRFNASPAFFPDARLRKELQADYERDVRPLFFGAAFPSFESVLGRLNEIRDLI